MQYHVKNGLLKYACLMLFSLLLTACGGGGGGGGGGGFLGDGGGGGNVTIQLEVEMFDSLGNSTNVLSGERGTIRVKVRNSQGAPLVDAVVNFTTTIGNIIPANGSALTDQDGVAEVTIETGSDAGAGTITISVEDSTDTVEFNFEVAEVRFNLELSDDLGNTITTLSADPGILTLRVTDAEGNALVGRVANFNTTLGAINPASGTALTNGSGVATIELLPGSASGAGTVTASIEGFDLTVQLNFQVNAPVEQPLRIGSFQDGVFIEGQLDVADPEIPFEGSTVVGFAIADSSGQLVEDETVDVRILSDCSTTGDSELRQGAIGGAELNLTVTGEDSFEYTAITCTGEDTIRATAGSATALGVVTVDPPTDVRLEHQQATDPANPSADESDPGDGVIAVQGEGTVDRPEVARVKFRLFFAESDAPVAGEQIDFTITDADSDVSLQADSDITNSAGIATAVVQGGWIPGSATVSASVTINDNLLRDSTRITVASSRPDQDSLSIAAARVQASGNTLDQTCLNCSGGFTFVTEGSKRDGEEVGIRVALSDSQNNPIPSGHLVKFLTRYGRVESSCLTGQDNPGFDEPDDFNVPTEEELSGVCWVVWESSEPREPLIYNDDFVNTIFNTPCEWYNNVSNVFAPCPISIAPYDGEEQIAPVRRNTLLVYTEGAESFIDANRNGVKEQSELSDDLTEPYADHNSDDMFNPGQGPECDPVAGTDAGKVCAAGLEEIYVEIDDDGVFTPGNDKYDGDSCPPDVANDPEGHCTRDLVHIFDTVPFYITSRPDGHFVSLATALQSFIPEDTELRGGRTYFINIADEFNIGPVPQSTVTVEATGGCSIAGGASAIVPQYPSGYKGGAFSTTFTVDENPDNDETTFGEITITLQSPPTNDQQSASVTYACRDFAGFSPGSP